jgi:hypothetical protein
MTEELQPPDGLYSAAEVPHSEPVDKIAFGTGWWELDQIFRMYPGQFVMVTGIAGHGKSTFLLNVITRIAMREGKRSFLYVPENDRNLSGEPIRKVHGCYRFDLGEWRGAHGRQVLTGPARSPGHSLTAGTGEVVGCRDEREVVVEFAQGVFWADDDKLSNLHKRKFFVALEMRTARVRPGGLGVSEKRGSGQLWHNPPPSRRLAPRTRSWVRWRPAPMAK